MLCFWFHPYIQQKKQRNLGEWIHSDFELNMDVFLAGCEVSEKNGPYFKPFKIQAECIGYPNDLPNPIGRES